MPNVSLPSVTSDIPRDLRAFIDRVREALNGGVFLTVAEYERLQKAAAGQGAGDIATATTEYARLNGDATQDFAAKDLTVDQLLLRGGSTPAGLRRREGQDEVTFLAGAADQCRVTAAGTLIPAGSDKSLGDADNVWATTWSTALAFTATEGISFNGTAIVFRTFNTDRWRIGNEGNLVPVVTDVVTLGSAYNFVARTYAREWVLADNPNVSPVVNTRVKTNAANEIVFVTANAERWRIGNEGNLVPLDSNQYALGSQYLPVKDVFFAKTNGVAESLKNLEARVTALGG